MPWADILITFIHLILPIGLTVGRYYAYFTDKNIEIEILNFKSLQNNM